MTQRSKSALVTLINSNISTNGNEEITGAILNSLIRDIIDSVPNLVTDNNLTGLSEYDSTKVYNRFGEKQAALYGGAIYQAKAAETNITGAWNAAKWDAVSTSSDFTNGGDIAGALRNLGNTDDFGLQFIIDGNPILLLGDSSENNRVTCYSSFYVTGSNSDTTGATFEPDMSVYNSNRFASTFGWKVYDGSNIINTAFIEVGQTSADDGYFKLNILRNGAIGDTGESVDPILNIRLYNDVGSHGLGLAFGKSIGNPEAALQINGFENTADYKTVLIKDASNASLAEVRGDGKVILNYSKMPTSASGLTQGTLWNDSGTIKIKT